MTAPSLIERLEGAEQDAFDVAESIGWRRWSKPDAKSGPRQFFCAMWNQTFQASVLGRGASQRSARTNAGRKAIALSQQMAGVAHLLRARKDTL